MVEDALSGIPAAELGARLRDARRARGFTQAAAAEALGLARTTIVAIEKGERRVSSRDLFAFAEIYGKTLRELLRPEAIPADFAVQLRTAARFLSTDLSKSIDDFQQLCADYVELERLVNAPTIRRYPRPYAIDRKDPERSAEHAAAEERNRLGLGDGPLIGLRQVLEEDVGARVFYLVFPSNVAAMFSNTEGFGACIAVNRAHQPDRRRMSLAHEYAHLVTTPHQSEIAVLERYQRVPENERFAETFARCFLMPEAGVRRRFHHIKLSRRDFSAADICRMAHMYYVSVEAMALRLEELSLLTKGSWDRLRSKGFKVREAHSLLHLQIHPTSDSVTPLRYQFLAVEAFEAGLLSEGQLARFLRMDRLDARATVQQFGTQESADSSAAVGSTPGYDLGE